MYSVGKISFLPAGNPGAVQSVIGFVLCISRGFIKIVENIDTVPLFISDHRSTI